MSQINFSLENKRFVNSVFRTLLISGFLLALFSGIFGQAETLNFRKPLKKCWEYRSQNGQVQIVASDNAKSMLIFLKENLLISFSSSSRSEIWKTEISGTFEQPAVSDDESVLFITSAENNERKKSFFLNSISLKTGITNWQKKIPNESHIELLYKDGILLLNESSGEVLAVRKADGIVQWEKILGTRITSMEMSAERHINILSDGQLLEVSLKTGQKLKEIKLANGNTSSQSLADDDLVLGYSTGEVLKVALGTGNILWKFKTGGNISSLTVYGDEILVTSFDNFVYLFSSKNGKLKWKRRVGNRINLIPLVFESYALTTSLGGNSLFIIDLVDGKVVNQVELEDNNYFLGKPVLQNDQLLLQTYAGIYAFAAAGC